MLQWVPTKSAVANDGRVREARMACACGSIVAFQVPVRALRDMARGTPLANVDVDEEVRNLLGTKRCAACRTN